MRATWLFLLAFSLPPRDGVAGGESSLDPALLALCRSSDPAARGYCLDAVARSGDPRGDARQILAGMAANDEVLHEEAARIYQRLYGARPPTPAPPTAVPPASAPTGEPSQPDLRRARSDAARSAGDPMRVIYAPTAFTRPEGSASFNAFELGTLAFDRGITPNLALGIQTALPIGALVIGPTLRAGFPFQGGAVGFQLTGILIAPYLGNVNAFFVGGGGPMLTLGDYDRYFNLGALAYFVSRGGGGVVAPHVGFSVRPSSHVRFGAELYLPALTSGSDSGYGRRGVLLWGVRLFGESFWGDIAFVDPFCGGCGSLYSALPLGIPFLNFGLGW